jgi:FkbM family methyltransferase
MFRIFIIKTLINFFDYFQQKKIFNFLRKKIIGNAILFDVGAHYGETIKNFIKYFKIKEIHSFEASPKNFEILNKKFKNNIDTKIILNNFGLSNETKIVLFNQFSESSSSTLSKINKNSRYFKRKIEVLGLKKNQNYFKNIEVKLQLLDEYLMKSNITSIDLLKIDTEGHEYYVLKGSLKNLSKIKYIYFEHHYDDMLKKGYTFSDIHNFLKKNDFEKILKSKMYFRKTFEYIYKNSKFDLKQ